MVRAFTLVLASVLAGGVGMAADLPSRTLPPPPPLPDRAIWGAIAYSPLTGADGFFWGGATEAEATSLAETHCLDKDRALAAAGAAQCRVATVFFNGWTHSTPVAPWPHCGAVAAGGGRWSAASGLDQESAAGEAIRRCGAATCVIVRDVCT